MRFNKLAAAVSAAALSGLLSASLLGTASAQSDECVASTEDGFDYQVGGPSLIRRQLRPLSAFHNKIVHHQLGASPSPDESEASLHCAYHTGRAISHLNLHYDTTRVGFVQS